MVPTSNPEDGFKDCTTLSGCKKLLTALNWGSAVVQNHILGADSQEF
jgi:hypothetical protein